MNAYEARKKAASITLGVHAKELQEVEKAIEDAVKKGEFKAHYYKTLSGVVETELKKKGFDVSSFSDFRDGTTVTISW